MTDLLEGHACEVCGALATEGVRDLVESIEPGDAFYTYRPLGPVHFFCRIHGRDSVTVCGEPFIPAVGPSKGKDL